MSRLQFDSNVVIELISYGDNDVDDVGNGNVMYGWNDDSDEGKEVDVHHLQVFDEDHTADDLDRVDWPDVVPVNVDCHCPNTC